MALKPTDVLILDCHWLICLRGEGLTIKVNLTSFNHFLWIFTWIYMNLKSYREKNYKNSAGVHDFKKAGPLFVWILVNGLLQDSTVKHFIRICEWMWKNYFAALLQVRFNITEKLKLIKKSIIKTTSFQCISLYTLWMANFLKAVPVFCLCFFSCWSM